MKPSNFIQWKGTDVCVDLLCDCGKHYHYDGYFLYQWKCEACGVIWSMGTKVEMTKMDGPGNDPILLPTQDMTT